MKKRSFVSKAVALLALLACMHGHALAWGKDGHRLIAELAYERLTPDARTKVDALLALEPGATLGSISSWADEVRSPSTARWHYVNFPRDAACRYIPDRDCPDGQCVVDAITRNVLALAGKGSEDDRLKALKWIVHLVGDVHQPFHAGFADDKGANLMQLQAFGRGTNLHALWDSGMVTHWRGGQENLRAAVQARLVGKRAQGDAIVWAEESCRVVIQPHVYPDGRFVDDAYIAQWEPIMAQRLADAASRLAGVLEVALNSQPRSLAARLTTALLRR